MTTTTYPRVRIRTVDGGRYGDEELRIVMALADPEPGHFTLKSVRRRTRPGETLFLLEQRGRDGAFYQLRQQQRRYPFQQEFLFFDDQALAEQVLAVLQSTKGANE